MNKQDRERVEELRTYFQDKRWQRAEIQSLFDIIDKQDKVVEAAKKFIYRPENTDRLTTWSVLHKALKDLESPSHPPHT